MKDANNRANGRCRKAILATVHAVADTQTRLEKRNPFHGFRCNTALAIAWLRGYAYDKQQLTRGRTGVYESGRGYNANRSHGQYNSRIIRCVDAERLMARLTPRDAAILSLKFVHGHSDSATAPQVGLSEGSVRSHAQQALDALAAILEHEQQI